jgi:hypothetical protein
VRARLQAMSTPTIRSGGRLKISAKQAVPAAHAHGSTTVRTVSAGAGGDRRTHPKESEYLSSANESGASPAKPIQYVCLPGSPFTGSTLLGALLNEHQNCSSIGAATGLIRRVDLTSYRCSCGERFEECEFWRHVAARTRALGHPVNVYETNFWNTHLRLSSNRLVNALLVRPLRWHPLTQARDSLVERTPGVSRAISAMGWNTWSLAAAVLELTGKSVFVDTARDHQRPKYLARHPLLDVRVIHLIRDPRGNTASIMKHTGVDVARAARQWRHYNLEAAAMKRYLPQASWMSLRYDEICADPRGVLDRISDFLGIERAIGSQGFGSQNHHIIGNPTRLKGYGEIREDLSWQTKLSDAELAIIARIAGLTSQSLGFNWP